MLYVLIGYMGSGKSVVGKGLAKKLSQPYTDLDTYTEKNENMSIPEIFSERGEIYFRKKEQEYLRSFLESYDEGVLSLGGGTPCSPGTMEFLNSFTNNRTVYLKASIETLTDRLFPEKSHRPLIAHIETENALRDFIRKHIFERSPYYSQAQIQIAVDTKSVAEIVAELLTEL